MVMAILDLPKSRPELHWQHFRGGAGQNFSRKVDIFAENSRYTLTTTSEINDLFELFQLRHDVFFGNGASGLGLDYDDYDLSFDHLVIREKMTGILCGTYRISSPPNPKDFYSATEFDLAPLIALPGRKLEVGRAAISPAHRNGLVLDLLWRGIGQYVQKTGADYLFGCSSIMSTSSDLAHQVADYFIAEGLTRTDFTISPTPKYAMPPRSTALAEGKFVDVQEIIPPLIHSYIRAGSTINALPALDLEFGSIDFLTILKISEIHPGYRKRYLS